MNKAIKAKIWITGSLVALLLVSVYLNYRFGGGNADLAAGASPFPSAVTDASPLPSQYPVTESAGTNAETDFIATYKQERQMTREEELKQLDAIITDANTDETTLQRAQEQKLSLIESMEQALTIESILEAKGFGETAAVITSTGATVVVENAIDREEAAQIMEIIGTEAGYTSENIKIVAGK